MQLGLIGLETGSGLVEVELERGESGRILFGRMNQPLPRIQPYERAEELLAALELEKSELPIELYDNGIEHVFVALGSEQQVAALEPDGKGLAAFGSIGVNCFAGAGKSWKTRCFVSGLGSTRIPPPLGRRAARPAPVPPRGRLLWRRDRDPPRRGGRRPSVLFAGAYGSADAVERIEVGGCAVVSPGRVQASERRLEPISIGMCDEVVEARTPGSSEPRKRAVVR